MGTAGVIGGKVQGKVLAEDPEEVVIVNPF